MRSRDGHFADKPENLISLINLATVRSLEAQWGYEIDPLRFRANIYVDDFKPWHEFDWIGADLHIGGVAFRVDRRNGRCGATNVNPVTGRRDLDIPGSLRAAFGHKDIGIYAAQRSRSSDGQSQPGANAVRDCAASRRCLDGRGQAGGSQVRQGTIAIGQRQVSRRRGAVELLGNPQSD